MARVSLALCLLAGTAQAKPEPLITTDIIHGTYMLLNDVFDFARQQVPVEIEKQIEDAIGQAKKQIGPLPPAVEDAIGQAKVATIQVRALVAEYTDKAYGSASDFAIQLIEKMEGAVPASKGLIRKSLGDLIVSVCYFWLVVYVLLEVLMFALRIASCIVCGICCCGFCCRKKSAAKKAGKKAGGKAAAKPAAAKPAAAKPAAAKSAAKPVANGKKK